MAPIRSEVRGHRVRGGNGGGAGDVRAPADLQPCPQAAELASGTLAATGACAVTATWRRIFSLSSESVAASPSAPSVASTCVAALQGCCVLTRTCLWGKRFGNIEDSQGLTPEPHQLSIKPLLRSCCGLAPPSLVMGKVRTLKFQGSVCSALGPHP